MSLTRNRMGAWIAGAFVALVAFSALAVAAPTDPARVDVRTTGAASVTGGGGATDAGKVVRLRDASARATLSFADGATVEVVGPAVVQVVEVTPTGRRIMLVSGIVSEARVAGIALEIQTPEDASLVLQNATGFARVAPRERITFQRKDGEYARVHHAGSAYDLRNSPWTVNLRAPTSTGPVASPEPTRGVLEKLPGDRARIRLGDRVVVVEPASGFKKTDLSGGGVRFCYEGKDDFGVVYVGSDTVLFLGPGECVDFDVNGNVTRFDGISHIYHPLDDQVPYDEPVEDAADASISRSSRR